MSAAYCFKQFFSSDSLKKIYEDKIRFRSSVGMDNVTPAIFDSKLDENIELISRKVLNGLYEFTRYREVLISKGRGKEPRVISIPSIRDKLALAAYHRFLQNVFSDIIEEPLLHTVVSKVSSVAQSGQFDGYVKIDITKFYSSINHDILRKKIWKKVRKKEALDFLSKAISTQTIPRNTFAGKRMKTDGGIPEGLSISNILANIYLSDLKQYVCSEYNVEFFRYVDDVLIFCEYSQAAEIKGYLVNLLGQRYLLKVNASKSIFGRLEEGVPYLGYKFYNTKTGIRPSAEQKLECSLEELFRKCKNKKLSVPLFTWRLNLRITGCILDKKKYGWMFYYSQLNDLEILFHLDWLIDRFFDRFQIKKSDSIKSFVRTYHEITKNVSRSTYLFNADFYSIDEKRQVLASIYDKANLPSFNNEKIDALFKEIMFQEVEYLERDIQNFS